MRRRSRHSGQALLSRAPRRTSTICRACPSWWSLSATPDLDRKMWAKTILIRASNPSPGTPNPKTCSFILHPSSFILHTWYY
ncbi:MAG: hypothetical protein ACXIU2_16020 [Cyclobacteriaceae bacterium]